MKCWIASRWLPSFLLVACGSTPERAAPEPSNEASGGAHSASGASSTTGGARTASSGGQNAISVTPGGRDSNGAASSGSDAAGTCGSTRVEAKVKTTEIVTEVPGNILFVFDQSSSMNESWNGASKLVAAKQAVEKSFAPLVGKLSGGAVLFPAPPSAASGGNCSFLNLAACQATLCPDVAPINAPPQISLRDGQSFLLAWRALWGQTGNTTQQGTPTEKGLLAAEAALQSPPSGGTAVVLVTDGQPTCGSNESAVAARLLQRGIKTYVVGLPGAQGAAILDAITLAGGTAPTGCTSSCYLSPDDPQGLEQALALVATRIVGTKTELGIDDCEFALSKTSMSNPNDVHVIVTDAETGQKFEVLREQPNGWVLSADQSSATLVGAVCEAARSGRFAQIDFEYGCVSAPPLPPR